MLSVHGEREDGYHGLTSLVVPLAFGDTLEVGVSGAPRDALECRGEPAPADGRNLVLRAADAFRERAGDASRFAFRLEKRIPLGAGLGGGSGNAATALAGMNRLRGNPLSQAELESLAAELGSDCPFFARGAPAVVRGRGEVLENAPAAATRRLRGMRVVLFKPDFAVPTAWAYGRLRETGDGFESEARAEERLRRFADGSPVARLLANALEAPVGAKYLALSTLLRDLRGETNAVCQMSGSGSCCFALPGAGGPSASELAAKTREAWGGERFFVETSIG